MAKRKKLSGKVVEESDAWRFVGPETGIVPPFSVSYSKHIIRNYEPDHNNDAESEATLEASARELSDKEFDDARALVRQILERQLGPDWYTSDKCIEVMTHMDYLLASYEEEPITNVTAIRLGRKPPAWMKELLSRASPQQISQLCEASILATSLGTIRFSQQFSRVEMAILSAYRAGQLHERIKWREYEQAAAGGIKSKVSSDKGRQTQQQQRRAAWAKWQTKVDELRFGKGSDWKSYLATGKKPKHSHDRACRLAADELGESYETIKDRVTNRTPRKPKR